MEIYLSELRKRAGYKNRDAFAEAIGVNRYTYRSWESGAAMMSLEQAFNCCIALGCTLNDLVGMGERRISDDELGLIECYRMATPRQRYALITTAETFRDGGLAKNNQVSRNARA